MSVRSLRRRAVLLGSLSLASCGSDDGGPSPTEFPGEIAYVANGAVEIRTLATGATRRIVFDATGESIVQGGLAWAPDATAIVFAQFNLERFLYELHRVPLDGSPQSILYPNEAHQSFPAFAPDGRLGYWVNGLIDGELHGYEIFVDGAPLSVCGGYCSISRPAWSPDGSSAIVVGRSQDGKDELIGVSLATGSEVVLFQAEADQSIEQLADPVYSHSGDRVAFTRIRFGDNSETDEIWVMGSDGSNPVRLTDGHYDQIPTWSPDDAWIAFERAQSPEPAIVAAVAASGGEVTRLATGGSPAWR